MEEQELIENARQGDLEAFNQLVLNYQTTVYNQAWYMLLDEDAAEDITQETFILAFRKLDHFRGGSFRSWLLHIAANASKDELRRIKRRPALSLTQMNEYDEEIESNAWLKDPGASVEETAEHNELRATIQRCIAGLPDCYRQAVILVDLLEMDYSEAAEAMHVPLGTVKSRLTRARMKLRRRLESSAGWQPNRMLAPACPAA